MAEEGTHVDIHEIGSTHFIRNVPISFPFSPYDCQLLYMEKVIQALQEVRKVINFNC